MRWPTTGWWGEDHDPPRIADISIHAEDPAARARFWCAVMGYPEWTAWPPEDEAALRAAGLDDADLAARAEAWDGDPAHQRRSRSSRS